MAKSSRRSHAWRAKDRLVCVWGLINFLDFLHFRSPRKMLIYKRQRIGQPLGSGRSGNEIEDSSGFDGNLRENRVEQKRAASVKKLLEEEMEKDPKESDLRRDGHRKKICKKSKSLSKKSQPLIKGGLEEGEKWEVRCSCPQSTEHGPESNPSDKNIVEEFCPRIYPNLFDEGVCEAVKEVLSRQLICGEHKELVNALDNLQSSHSIREKVSISFSKSDLSGDGKYKQANFSRKEAETRETTQSDENRHAQMPNTVVALKPELISSETARVRNASVKGQNLRIITRSFLSSIKRRLKSAISSSKDCSYVEKSSGDKAGESCRMADNSEQRVAKIYIDAKKYLSEMLRDGDGIGAAETSDKLGWILALPEYSCSPVGSPSRDTSASPLVKHPGDIGNYSDSNSVVSTEQVIETKVSIHETVVEESALATAEYTNLEENTGEYGEISPGNCSSGHVCEASEDNECDRQARKNFDDEEADLLSPKVSPPCALFAENAEHQEIGFDKTGQPSPVSVMEPLFSEDDYSPPKTTSRSRGHPIELLQIEFEDRDDSTMAGDINAETLDKGSIFDFVKTVLHTLKLSWDQLYLKSLSLEQLLEVSSVQEADIMGEFLFPDCKLLLDCINEVLLEFCNHYSVPSCSCFYNKIIGTQKVCDRVYWHLIQPPFPRTLEQIVGKDLSGTETWMDLHSEAECVGIDMGEIILEELIQDSFASCLSRTSEESENSSAISAGQLEN